MYVPPAKKKSSDTTNLATRICCDEYLLFYLSGVDAHGCRSYHSTCALTGKLLGLYDIGLYPSAFSRVVAKRIRLSLILMSTSSLKHSNVSSAAVAVAGTVRNGSATYAGMSLRSFVGAHCSGANVSR